MGEVGTSQQQPQGFEQILSSPARLRIAACLAAEPEIKFSSIRDDLAISAQLLSKQLSILRKAGYVIIRKQPEGELIRTYVSLSQAGRNAFARHAAALKAVIDGVQAASATQTDD